MITDQHMTNASNTEPSIDHIYRLLANMVNNDPSVIEFSFISTRLLEIYSFIVIVLGNIFNTINFACFYRIKKRSSQNVYLSFLSLAELFNININILLPLLRSKVITINNAIMHSTFLCKLEGYLVEIGLLVPPWVMVILTCERFISIQWPLRKSSFCRPKHAMFSSFILTVIVCLFSLYKLETAGIENRSTFHPFCCRKVTMPYLVNFSTVMWALVPELLTLILNILIIRTIKTTTDPHKRFYSSNRIRRFNQATRLVVMLSIIFIALISPTGVLIIVEIILRSKYKEINIYDHLINNDPETVQSTQAFGLHNNDSLSLYAHTNQTASNMYNIDDTFKSLLDLDFFKTLLAKNKLVMNLTIARKFALILYETNLIVNFPIYLVIFKNFRESLFRIIPKIHIFKRKDSDKIGYKNCKNKCIQNNSLKSHKYRLASSRKPIVNKRSKTDKTKKHSQKNEKIGCSEPKFFKYNHVKTYSCNKSLNSTERSNKKNYET